MKLILAAFLPHCLSGGKGVRIYDCLVMIVHTVLWKLPVVDPLLVRLVCIDLLLDLAPCVFFVADHFSESLRRKMLCSPDASYLLFIQFCCNFPKGLPRKILSKNIPDDFCFVRFDYSFIAGPAHRLPSDIHTASGAHVVYLAHSFFALAI